MLRLDTLSIINNYQVMIDFEIGASAAKNWTTIGNYNDFTAKYNTVDCAPYTKFTINCQYIANYI